MFGNTIETRLLSGSIRTPMVSVAPATQGVLVVLVPEELEEVGAIQRLPWYLNRQLSH